MVVTDCLFNVVLSSWRCIKEGNRQKQGCFTAYLSAEVADVARCLVDAALQSSAGIVPLFVLSDVASSRCGSTCDHDRPQAVVRDAASFLELGFVGLRQISVQDRGTAFVPANRGQLVAIRSCRSSCNQFGCGAQSLRVGGIFVGMVVDVCLRCDALVWS